MSPAATHTHTHRVSKMLLDLGWDLSCQFAQLSCRYVFVLPIFLISSEGRDSPCPVGRETNGHFLNSWTG